MRQIGVLIMVMVGLSFLAQADGQDKMDCSATALWRFFSIDPTVWQVPSFKGLPAEKAALAFVKEVATAKGKVGFPTELSGGGQMNWQKVGEQTGPFFVAHVFSPTPYRPLPYRFRFTGVRVKAIYCNGNRISPEKNTGSDTVFILKAHRFKAGLNRLVVEVGGHVGLLQGEMEHPGDVRLLGSVPKALDPARNLNTWEAITLTNGEVTADVAIPDLEHGLIRSNRFEQAGIITRLRYRGHSYFYEDGKNHQPVTSGWGMSTVEEMSDAIGWQEAAWGEPFIKIGVGLFDKCVEASYRWYSVHWPEKFFPWEMTRQGENAVVFRQEVRGPRDWGYVYTKRLVLVEGEPVLKIEHELCNTGKKLIQTNQYAHNWIRLDDKPIGEGVRLQFNFEPEVVGQNAKLAKGVLKVMDKDILIESGKVCPVELAGWRWFPEKTNYCRISSSHTPAAIEISGDFPMSKLAYFSTAAAVCPEPFIQLSVLPGKSSRWIRTYRFY